MSALDLPQFLCRFCRVVCQPRHHQSSQLAKLAGTSIYVGSVSNIANGFKGSAVMTSDQPIVATLVQVAAATTPVKVRPLSNGFTSGSSYVLVPTVLKAKYDYTSVVSVQNVDSVTLNYRLVFVPTAGSSITITTNSIPSGSTKFYDLGKLSALPAGFTGSLRDLCHQGRWV